MLAIDAECMPAAEAGGHVKDAVHCCPFQELKVPSCACARGKICRCGVHAWHALFRAILKIKFEFWCTAGIVVEDVFNAFAVAAFFEFVVFAIFEMRYLLLVWRARRANALDPWAAQRELSVLYARFYGVLLAGVFLGYQLHLCAL